MQADPQANLSYRKDNQQEQQVPSPIATRFTKFEFTESELFAASRFNEMQLMLFQTLIASAAESKVNLTLDFKEEGVDKETAVILHAQRQGELIGEIRAYEHLLLLYSDTSAPVVKTEPKPVQFKGS
jgi:hypothetical protein